MLMVLNSLGSNRGQSALSLCTEVKQQFELYRYFSINAGILLFEIIICVNSTRRQLKNSHKTTKNESARSLFVAHTFLVFVCEYVSSILRESTASMHCTKSVLDVYAINLLWHLTLYSACIPTFELSFFTAFIS